MTASCVSSNAYQNERNTVQCNRNLRFVVINSILQMKKAILLEGKAIFENMATLFRNVRLISRIFSMVMVEGFNLL